MVLLSAVVATAGLLSDSSAVVVGSMVIAPLLGPALAASVGVVTGDDGLRRTGFRYQIVGVAVVIAASIGIAVLARLGGLEPAGVDIVPVAELEERVSPNLLSLAVALGAGIAGVLSLTRGFSEAIVGVMIAAALIPPAAAVGITAGWGMYGAAAGALKSDVLDSLTWETGGDRDVQVYEPSLIDDASYDKIVAMVETFGERLRDAADHEIGRDRTILAPSGSL